MNKQYKLAGYIRREGIDYGFLVPVFINGGQYYYQQLSPDGVVLDYLPYDEFDEGDSSVVLLKRKFFSFGAYRHDQPKLIIGGKETVYVFKFFEQVVYGTADNTGFIEFVASCAASSRLKNEALRKQLFRQFGHLDTYLQTFEKWWAKSSTNKDAGLVMLRKTRTNGLFHPKRKAETASGKHSYHSGAALFRMRKQNAPGVGKRSLV